MIIGRTLLMGAVIALGMVASSTTVWSLDWQAAEHRRYYSVSGATGLEIYRNIGEQGPRVGLRRAIGLTEWDLKWRRNYLPKNGGCRVTDVKPFLTITTTLPRAVSIPETMKRQWQAFLDGIETHEDGHALRLKIMVDEIIAATSELIVDDDPDCRKAKEDVQRRVKSAFDAYTVDNRAFETTEMSEGGNVHRLILDFVDPGR